MSDDIARDKAIEKLLAAKLRGQAAPERPTRGKGCLDSETLAAYAERTLAPRERLACEAHLATCASCQDQIAELVRLSEADQPAVERPAALRAPGVLGTTLLRWAWAAPALAAIVVAGLFWYSREPRGLRPASAPASSEVTMKAPAPVLPSLAPSMPPAVAENKPTLPAPARPATSFALRESKQMAKVASASTPAASGGVAKSEAAPVNGRSITADNLVRLESAAPSGTGAATPTGVPLGGVGNELTATRDERLGPAGGVAGGVIGAPISESKEATAAASAESAPAAVAMSVQAMKVEAGEPTKAVKKEAARQKLARADRSLALDAFRTYASGNWRVGAHGLIEKPGPGHSWLAVPSGVDADLNAIAFPTPSVGWVVGQSGTVLRSTDGGATWQKVTFPTDEDLMRVSAASDQAARVVTSGGKIFVTVDGGKSWQSP